MTKSPAMSADQSHSFDRFSVANAATVTFELERRRPSPCHCEPYIDVFTFNRWWAQGRTVRKGEHGIRLPVIIHGETADKETGETHGFSMRRASFVFCRCQTDPLMHRAFGIATPSPVIVEIREHSHTELTADCFTCLTVATVGA